MTEPGEFRLPPQDVTQNFIDAMDSVATYNHERAGVGRVGNFVAGILASLFEDGDTYTAPDAPEVSEADQAAMERELVRLLHTDELQAMGIQLFDPSSYDRGHLTQEELEAREDTPVSLLTVIADGEAFSETLDQMNPGPDQTDQVTKHVAALLANTADIISTGYSVHGEDENAEITYALHRIVHDQLELFLDLVPKLAAKGFTQLPAYQKLAEYIARYADGTLDEYLGAETKGLLQGPSRWHRDASPQILERNWTTAFAYLKQLREQGTTSSFYRELFERLHRDFFEGQAYIDVALQNPEMASHWDGYYRPLQLKFAEMEPIWAVEFPAETMLMQRKSD